MASLFSIRSPTAAASPTSNNNNNSASVFVSRSLNQIMKLSSRKHVQLRAAIKDVLDHLAKKSKQDDSDSVKYFTALKLACESKTSKIIETALDCLQKLMAYGYIDGKSLFEGKPLMDVMVETICNCFEIQDDAVQLQIVKALLTAVTSPKCDVHGKSLRLAVKTCFNIHLVSKNLVNQTTAKATLTQMLNIIFKRMEHESNAASIDSLRIRVRDGDDEPPSPAQRTPKRQSTIIAENQTNTQQNDDLSSDTQQKNTESGLDGQATEQIVQSYVNEIIERVVEQNDTEDASTTPTTPTKQRDYSEESITSNEDMAGEGPGEAGTMNFSSQYQIDAFLLFRALCRLSMKPLPQSTTTFDSIEMRSRILSLELLLSVLENSGPFFRSNESFIAAIKQYLCLSLLKNCVSTISSIFRLSLAIFLTLISFFKDHLKTEIGVFFTNVFLRILESANSTFQHKMLVIQVIYKICQDPQTIVDLFVNYDCDLDALNIYESMVKDLSRVVQSSHSELNWVTPAQEGSIKMLGLECLVMILKSLVDWMGKTQPQANNAGARYSIHLGSPSAVGDADDDAVSVSSEDSRDVADVTAVPVVFERQKQMKAELEKGVAKFNIKPKKGIQYIVDCGIINNTPQDIAKFLHTTEGLNKTMIGEYLGEGDQFNIDVLYAYVDMMNFKGMDFVQAIRYFLSGFRLPGEAQKIDRMMEKFAQRYCHFNNDNNQMFSSSDTAYVLAYSVIMLNTDLHSPMVKKRMSEQDFLNNNRGIDGGKDVPKELLQKIYRDIKENEIILEDERSDKVEETMKDAGFLSTVKKKQLLFNIETEQMFKKTQELFQRGSTKSTYFYATDSEHVRPMFEVSWAPMLAAFSILLEELDSPKVIQLCLSGFEYGIHISSIFYLETQRNAFVSSLTKFTFLTHVKEMKQKNIDSIKLLLKIALSEGNYLQSSWIDVLKCISQLERLHLLGSGAKPDYNFVDERARAGSSQDIRRMTEDVNAQRLADQIDSSVIDRIFTKSSDLNSEAVVHFVSSLCAVSREEVSSPTEPRMFSLQKLVEVATYNMSRIRIVWSKIWSHMAEHFTRVGCHENLSIAMYCIDSLRQLSMKFLEKDELASYQFQRDFLKPFDVIMNTTTSIQIRELIVRCIHQMVLARARNIKSGWKSILLVLTSSAADKHEHIVTLSFEVVDRIMKDYFALITETFVDMVNCLMRFAGNPVNSEISLKAVEHIPVCTIHLVQGKVEGIEAIKLPPGATASSMLNSSPRKIPVTLDVEIVYNDSENHLRVWFPILTGLSRLVSDPRLAIRVRALNILNDVLRNYGPYYSAGLWELIFRGVLFPIFDDIKHMGAEVEEDDETNEWLKTTCHKALSILVELFSFFYDRISYLLSDVLELVCCCVKKESENLTQIGISCLLQLVKSTGAKFTPEVWDVICSKVQMLFERSIPSEIAAFQPPPTLKQQQQQQQQERFNIEVVNVKCVTQLLLIQAVDDMIFSLYEVFPRIRHLQSLLDSLRSVYDSARQLNEMDSVRAALIKSGPSYSAIAKLLIEQERNTLTTYFNLLLKMFTDEPSSKPTADETQTRREAAEDQLISMWNDIVERYINKAQLLAMTKSQQQQQQQQTENAAATAIPPALQETAALVPIVVLLLDGILKFNNEQFAKYLMNFYPYLTNLIMSPHKEIRDSLRVVFVRVRSNLVLQNK